MATGDNIRSLKPATTCSLLLLKILIPHFASAIRNSNVHKHWPHTDRSPDER